MIYTDKGKSVYHSSDDDSVVYTIRRHANGLIQSLNIEDSVSLLHYGVKGMKWGVRRSRNKGPSTIARHISSAKRDLGHRKKLKNLKNMTDDELRSTTDRIRRENDLKRLTATKKKKTSNAYLDRAKLSDSELKRKVERLQLEDNLKKQVSNAQKPYKEAAKKFIKSAVNIGLDVAGDKFSPTGNEATDQIVKTMIKAYLEEDKNKQTSMMIKAVKGTK